MTNMLERIIPKNNNVLSPIEEQVKASKELTEPLRELSHSSIILKNLNKYVQNIEKTEQFKNIQQEVNLIIRDLAKIKEIDVKINKLGKKIISKFKDPKLEIKKETSQKITLITVEEQEIVRDEKQVIEIVKNNNYSIKLAINYLKRIIQNKFQLKNKMNITNSISTSLIQIKQVYLTAQAIIKLEARVKQENQKLEEELKKIKLAA